MVSMRLQEAHFQVIRVMTCFSGFLLKNGRLPRDLQELVTDGRMMERDLVDPWGTPLRYEITDPLPMWYQIGSAGPDRTFGTEDDIVQQVSGRK